MFKNKRLEELKEDLLDVRARISRFMEGQTRVNDIVHEAFTHSPNIGIKRLHRDAIIPKYQTKGAAGFDLHACIENGPIKLNPGESKLIKTGIAMEIEEGFEVQIRSRSGLAFKNAIQSHFGTIDHDYVLEIGVILFNHSKDTFVITHGDRIAQAVVARSLQANIKEIDEITKGTERNGGFGSTGVK